jgi:membrane fusion protein, multidrug efflux system
MKSFNKFLIIAAIIGLVTVVIVRLIANRNSFNEELKMITESNATIPVITDTVRYKQMATELSVNGTFSASQEVTIIAESQGKVVSICSKSGDKVVAGQIMASIDNENYAAQFELAKFNLDKAKTNMNRYEQLSRTEAATIQQYETAKQEYINAQSAYTTAKIQYENTNIKAPFDGIITKQYIEKGSYLAPVASVFDIVSINKVKFIIKLTGVEVEKVHKGQTIKVTANDYPGVFYEGIISAIIIKSDISKRYEVEVEITNRADNLIKPGMFGTATFMEYSKEQILTIPRQSLTGSIKNPEVFIVIGDSVNLQKIIATSLNDKDVMVKEGLKAGDIIVTSGQISLVNGSKIKLND